MFICSSTAQACCQRHLRKTLTIYPNHNPSSAKARRSFCHVPILQASSVVSRCVKLSNNKKTCAALLAVRQNRSRRLNQGRQALGCHPTDPPQRISYTANLHFTVVLARKQFSRHYTSNSTYSPAPQRPVSKAQDYTPNSFVASRTTLSQTPYLSNGTQADDGLRPEPIRNPLPTEIDAYKESARVVRRLEQIKEEQRKVEQEQMRIEEEQIRTKRQEERAEDIAQSLIMRQWRQNKSEPLRLELEQRWTEVRPMIPGFIASMDYELAEIGNELVIVETEVCKTTERFHSSFSSDLAAVTAEIRDRELALTAIRKQREEAQASFQPRVEPTAWWANIQTATEWQLNTDQKTFSDMTARIARLREDYLKWHDDYTVQLSSYHFARAVEEQAGTLMYQIHESMLDLLGSGQRMLREAHFARLYRRLGRSCGAETGAFNYAIERAPLVKTVSELDSSTTTLLLCTVSYSRLFWKRRLSNMILRDNDFPNRLVDLCYLVRSNTGYLQRISDEFSFGVLSNDYAPAIQMRRAQAAALAPFWTAIRGSTVVVKDLSLHLYRKGLKGSNSSLEKEVMKLMFSQRETMMLLDQFTAANWRSNSYRLLTRTVFLRPRSQPERSVSPVIFNVPSDRPIRPEWNHNDYRGPQGERITIVYAQEPLNMEKALEQLQDEAVVSLDVRWAPMDSGIIPRWFGNNVSVVTLSTQSQIVVCHLAMPGYCKLHSNIPKSLRQILENPQIIKVGMNISELQRRFMQYLGIFMVGTCDIGSLDVSVRLALSARSELPRPMDVQKMVWEYFKQHLPSLPPSDRRWLFPLSLTELQCATLGAYACLRLFFDLTKIIVDLKSELSVPINGCSHKTVEELLSTLPITAKDERGVSEDAAKGSLGEEAQEGASEVAPIPYEHIGNVWITHGSRSRGKIAHDWSRDLAELTMKSLQARKSDWPALQLYHLWRSLQFDCDYIEDLLPQPDSNLPALILEVIEKFHLSYHPQRYIVLQKTALVQWKTSQKLDAVEETLSHSWIADLSEIGVKEQVTGLMGVVRAKIKAESWIDTAVEKGKLRASKELQQELLPFVMWHVQRASMDNIARLLLKPKSDIETAINAVRDKTNGDERDFLASVEDQTTNDPIQRWTSPSWRPTSFRGKIPRLKFSVEKESSGHVSQVRKTEVCSKSVDGPRRPSKRRGKQDRKRP